MSVPLTTRIAGGPWNTVLKDGDSKMGFLTSDIAQERQVSNQAPPIRIGGSAADSDGTFEQLLLEGFETGGDKERFEAGERRYGWSDGNVALYVQDRITLDTQWEVEDASITPTAPMILDFTPTGIGDYIVLGEGTHLRIYDDDDQTWKNEQPSGGAFGGIVRFMLANDEYLFVAFGSGLDMRRWDGTKSTGWTTLTGVQADCLAWFGPWLVRGVGNELYIAKTDNTGVSANWNTAVKVGWDSTSINHIWPHGDLLYIAKDEGVYIYDGTDAKLEIDAETTRANTLFKGTRVWQGAHYAPWLNSMHKLVITGRGNSTVTDITPVMTGDAAKEQYGHGTPKWVFSGPRWLYVVFDDGEGVYPEMLGYSGIGWHQFYRGTSGATLRAAGYSRLKNWLLLNDGSTRRRRIRNIGLGPYPDYAASGVFTTPWIDAGYPDEDKAWASLKFETEDCDADNPIAIAYKVDAEAAFTPVATLIGSGPQTVTLATPTELVKGKRIQYQFTLSRDTAADTPRIKLPIIVRLKVTPRGVDAFNETYELEPTGQLYNGKGTVGDDAGYSPTDYIQFLESARNSKNLLIHTNEFGERKRVIITNLDKQWNRASKDTGQKIMVTATFLDMFTGPTIYGRHAIGFTLSGSQTPVTGDWLVDSQGNLVVDSQGSWIVPN